jgi:membrane protein DedA with SNARE-associated domain
MRATPIVVAVAVAAVTVWRWPRLGWALRGLGVAACAALVLYGADIIHLPPIDEVIASIGSSLGAYTYALVAVMAFLETGAFVGLVVPGETVVIVGGVVAGQGHLELGLLIGLTWLCAFAGDVTGYLLGRRLGRRFLLSHGPRLHITEPRLRRVEAFFARYGPATILIGRFVGLVRPVAPFLAGASKYPPERFVALAVAGTALWSATFVLLGYLFWQSLDEVLAIAKRGSLAVGGTVVLAFVLVAGYRYVRGRLNRPRPPEPPPRTSSRRAGQPRNADASSAAPRSLQGPAKAPSPQVEPQATS